MPTKDELLVLADYYEQRGDPRAQIARCIENPNDLRELLALLDESSQYEAASVFATRTSILEWYGHWEPHFLPSAARRAKRTWLRAKSKKKRLRKASVAATWQPGPYPRPGGAVSVSDRAVVAAKVLAVHTANEARSAVEWQLENGMTWKAIREAERRWRRDWIMRKAWQ
jgi:hypothetical protein